MEAQISNFENENLRFAYSTEGDDFNNVEEQYFTDQRDIDTLLSIDESALHWVTPRRVAELIDGDDVYKDTLDGLITEAIQNPFRVTYSKTSDVLIERELDKIDPELVQMLGTNVPFEQAKKGIVKMAFHFLWNGRKSMNDPFIRSVRRIAQLLREGHELGRKDVRTVYTVLQIANELTK